LATLRRENAALQARIGVSEEEAMHVVVRRYQGASPLFDELARRQADVEQLLRGVPGFVAYYLARTQDGGVTVTVCDDRAGTQESTRRAADWVRQNVPAAVGNPPEVTEGEVLYQFTR
jgi:heme-degrading monooxygenase HmoA